jgi:hypothetical protein
MCKTYEANRNAFDKWAIIPRMMRDCTARNLEVQTTSPSKSRLSDPVILDNYLWLQTQSSDTFGPDRDTRNRPSRG